MLMAFGLSEQMQMVGHTQKASHARPPEDIKKSPFTNDRVGKTRSA